MTTTVFHPSLTSESSFGLVELKNALIESLLTVGAALFWIVALPFVAFSLMCVRVWDTLVALKSGAAIRPNPLILRRGLVKSSFTARSSTRAAGV